MSEAPRFRGLSSIGHTTHVVCLGGAYCGKLFHIGSTKRLGIPCNQCGRPGVIGRINVHTLRKCFYGTGVRVHRNSFTSYLVSLPGKTFICLSPPCVPVATASTFANCARNNFKCSRRMHLHSRYIGLHRRNVRFLRSGDSYRRVQRLCGDFGVRAMSTGHSVGSHNSEHNAIGRILVDS